MSAEVTLQKFSFPFACSVSLSPQDKVTQKGSVLVKDPELHKRKESPILGEQNCITVVQAFLKNEDQTLKSTQPPDGGAARLSVSAEASQNAAVAGQSITENLRVEGEDQRPAAKRQLSSESAAKSITAVKKSALTKEPNEQRHLYQKAQLGQRGVLNAPLPGKRKCGKDLLKSSEVFHELDSHVIRAGAEVRTLFCIITEEHCLPYVFINSLFSAVSGSSFSPVNVNSFTNLKLAIQLFSPSTVGRKASCQAVLRATIFIQNV